MTEHWLHALAVVGVAGCWGLVGLAWLAGALHFGPRSPSDRTHTWWQAGQVSLVIVLVIELVVPKRLFDMVAIQTWWIRMVGLVLLLAATALTIWARYVLGSMWSAAPRSRSTTS